MKHLTPEEIAADSSKILREIGMPVSLLGYQYVRYGIVLTINDMTVLRRMKASFYQAIAERFDTTWHNVERAIRCAVEEACNRTTPDVLEKYFGNTISSSKGKPTNREFVATLAYRIMEGT